MISPEWTAAEWIGIALSAVGAVTGVMAAVFAFLTFLASRVRIKYRIRHDLVDRTHFAKVPLIIRVTNKTGGTIFREYAYIEFPQRVQMPPQSIVHEPVEGGHKRQIRPGDTIVITYEMMYLCEQLLLHGYQGKARVKFVFAEAEKDHKQK